MTTTLPQLPHMVFTLVGDWRQIRLTREEHVKGDIERVTNAQFPEGDHYAPLRILARERYLRAAELARDGGAVGMFVLGQIAKNVPLPAVLTVYAPEDLVIAPAVGTDPQQVMDTFKEARASVGMDEDLFTFSTPQSQVARLVRTSTVDVNEATEDTVEAPMLEVDYWMTVPGSKRMVQIVVQTPVVHAPNIATRYFDRTVGGIQFITEEART